MDTFLHLDDFPPRDITLSLVTAFAQRELDVLTSDYPGHRLIGRNPTGYLLFEHDGDLFMLLPGGQVMEMRGKWAFKGAPFEPALKASRLDLPYEAIRHQDLPGGVLVTFLRVMMPPAGLIGAQPQIMPMGTTFIPGVYMADAVDSQGNRGMFAVQIGVTLEELGLKPFEAPMGGMVMQ